MLTRYDKLFLRSVNIDPADGPKSPAAAAAPPPDTFASRVNECLDKQRGIYEALLAEERRHAIELVQTSERLALQRDQAVADLEKAETARDGFETSMECWRGLAIGLGLALAGCIYRLFWVSL